MNYVYLMGRATGDPEVREVSSGHKLAKITVAVDKKLAKAQKELYIKEGKATADFLRVSAWGKTAEGMEKYLKKGSRLCVAGSIAAGSYEKEGERSYFTEIHADRIQIIDMPVIEHESTEYFEEVEIEG